MSLFLENPFRDVCIRPVVTAPFLPEKKGSAAEMLETLEVRERTSTSATSPEPRRFAWDHGPPDRRASRIGSSSSTPRSREGPPSGPARKLSAKLFSLFPTPTGPVTLEMIVDRGRPSSTPSTRRTPRPAPDFRQTEDWQRAKEAQQKRGHAPSVELTRTEQRPGLRPLSRRSRQRSQEAPSEERRKDLGPLQGDCDGDECRTDQHDEDELSSAWPAEKLPDRTAPLLARRPPTPATGGSPTFGRGAVAKDPDLLVPWPHEVMGEEFEEFPAWPHEM